MGKLQIKLIKNAKFEENKEYSVLYETPLIAGYTDVTETILGWWQHGNATGKDYKYIRQQIKGLVPDFNLLSDSDKIMAGQFMVSDPVTVSSSGILGADFEYYKNDWIKRSAESRVARWEAAKSLGFNLIANAKRVLSEIINDGLHNKYVEGIESLVDDGAVGLFDCLESTNTYVGAGLISNGYTPLNPEHSMSDISTLLMDILRNGNY